MFVGLVQRVRRDFYKGKQDRFWYGQQHMVKKALLYPASWLEKRKVEIPAARYEAIVGDILDTILAKGNLDGVQYMSRYLLFCFQEHMKHHGEDYYREGTAIRNRVSVIMTRVERAARGEDGTVLILAQADQLLQIGKRKAKIQTAAKQPDLFL